MELSQKKTFVNTLLDSHLDSNVYNDILKTYAKETISLIKYGNLNITNVNTAIVNQIQMTESELSPFHKHDIDCDLHFQYEDARKPSLSVFNQKKIDFFTLKRFLVESFSPSENNSRPYPSAGGIYPVEPLVFLFPERIDNFAAHIPGCYHFRPLSKKLQLIKPLSIDYFFDTLIHEFMNKQGLPCFSMLYLASIGKAIVKYRYRGYRHALMEAGSMYQQAAVTGQKMELRNTVWSTFSDQELLHAVELDHSAYMPLTLQFFGYGD